MSHPRQHTNEVIAALDNDMIDKDYLILALLNALSDSEVHECMQRNDILLGEDAEFDDWGSIGEPS